MLCLLGVSGKETPPLGRHPLAFPPRLGEIPHPSACRRGVFPPEGLVPGWTFGPVCPDRSRSTDETTPGTIDDVSPTTLHDALARLLVARLRPDGGLPVSLDGEPEVEPTALAALALDDEGPRAWLAARQREDGGYDDPDGRPTGPTTAALAALALESPEAARRALAYAIAGRGLPLPNAPDPKRETAWGWTDDARSLVEPTARILLAVNALTPGDAATRNEALDLLRTRQCADGGWNFGNASLYDVDLRGYAQTTAIGLVALQDGEPELVGPALDFLRRSWALEPGGLTAAQALVAFRLHGVDDALPALHRALADAARRPLFLERPLSIAWAALATAPDERLEPLRSRA